MNSEHLIWIEGYYPPDIDAAGGFEVWQRMWSMHESTTSDWVWINGDWRTEAQTREALYKASRDLGTYRVKR